jgi:hypothetical protein
MTPRIGPYSPLAAIVAKAGVDTDRPGVQLRLACDLGQSPSSGVSFPHPMTVSRPGSVADGTPNGTQKALTLPVGRPSVISGDWPRSRQGIPDQKRALAPTFRTRLRELVDGTGTTVA